ncbi:hypothetical protein [Kribbella sp. NPDC004875]
MRRIMETLLAFTRSWLSPTGPLREQPQRAPEEPPPPDEEPDHDDGRAG